MSNARELALLEKWSSDGATIIPPLSSPTSPKATKFCCCPNRRRYNIKQPKLTTTLHVRNIFVDNDFNFIDDPTLNEDDEGEGDSQAQQLTIENTKNYKRAESWPSAKRAHKYNLNHNHHNNTKQIEAEVHKENLQNNVAEENDYDDVVVVEEIVNKKTNNSGSSVITKELKAKENELEVNREQVRELEVAEGEVEQEERRHNKSCHNNRNNCLTNEHERKSNSSRCYPEFTHKEPQQLQQQQQREHHQEEVCRRKSTVKKPLKQSGNEDSSNATTHTNRRQHTTTTTDTESKKECENFKKTNTNLDDTVPQTAIANKATNEQIIIPTTPTNITASPLIQRPSEVSELKYSLSKTTFSNNSTTNKQQQQPAQLHLQQHCNNCQFCFNQNCRNFSQLQQSLQSNNENCHNSYSNNKMTITSQTNVANNRKRSVVNSNTNSNSNASECDTITLPQQQQQKQTFTNTTATLPCLLINSTKMPATPTSPIPRSNTNNTPASPLTTTVIKTTMVKRSPANESTATSPATTPTSASLSLEKSLAFTNNVQDVAKENKPANSKSLTISTTSCSATAPAASATATNTTASSSAPLSVKERIAALVAGNEQIHKQHDNFIKHKNQCNKPMKLITQNMTCQQPIITNNSSNIMCQKLAAAKEKSSFTNDEIDGSQTSVELKDDTNDNLNHKSSSPVTAALSTTTSSSMLATSLLKSSKPGSAATIPRCSQSLTNHNAANKYGSIKETPTTTSSSSSTSLEAATNTMTLDNQQNILSNNVLSKTAATQPSSSTSSLSSAYKQPNDTSIDKSNHVLAATGLTKIARGDTSRNKLAALDNLDLALNLSNLPLEGDEDEDPYFELQEYLERVKHEINEVFELHKARQKQQQHSPQLTEGNGQEQQRHKNQQQLTVDRVRNTLENQIVDTIKAAVSNDELSRSTESDSGFDSASCSGCAATLNSATTTTTTATNSCSNKLPSRAKMTTIENENGNNNDKQQQTATSAAATNKSKNNQKMPTNTSLICLQQENKQLKQQDASTSSSSLPFSTGMVEGEAEEVEASSSMSSAASSSTLKRLRKQLQMKSAAEAATDDVNMWANKFLRDLDNLIASDKPTTSSSGSSSPTANVYCSSPSPSSSSATTSPMLLSAAASAVIQSRYGKGAHDRSNNNNSNNNGAGTNYDHNTIATSPTSSTSSANGIVLRPEKHATIPLQSFNLDCGRLDNASGTATSSGGNVTKTNVAYLRTLSAPTPSPSHNIYQQLHHNHGNKATCGSNCITSGFGSKKQQRNSLAGGIFNATFDQHHQQQLLQQNLTNFQSNEAALNALTAACSSRTTTNDTKSTMSTKITPTTILKIEETLPSSASSSSLANGTCMTSSSAMAATDLETLQQKRLRQLNIEMDNIRNTSIDQSQQLSALMQQNHYCNYSGNNSSSNNGNLNNNNKHKNLMTTTSSSAMTAAIPKKHSVPSNSPCAVASVVTCVAGKQVNSSPLTQQQHHNAATATSYLLHGSDATKKGSTSTIWTSEESILRSVGAVDEDNNSTSSSACEEASGVLSSGKSGISLDSSGMENDNNESGIGTATPPKDMSYWRGMPHRHNHHHHSQQDNESITSLDVLRKMKFQKGSSVTSSDDPDLLEVLSLCDETHDEDDDDVGDDETKSLKEVNEEDMDDYDMVDEEDEGHDDFEVVTYCDCEYTEDGDNSSASAGSTSTQTNSSLNNGSQSDTSGVVLRRKYAASPIMVPYPTQTVHGSPQNSRAQKCRSHSLDTSSLPNSYHHAATQQTQFHAHHHHSQAQLARKLQHLRDRHKDRNQLSLALRQEPFQSLLAPTHFHELPSPSSASLHSGHEILDTQELSTKSNSAPLLLKQEKRRDDFANQNVTLRYSRSQSDRYLAEIEAVEACKWLRAAGFPQYAQMYEDHQFPIDLTNVAKDHTNLENDQLQSLYRRLCILNRCANMRVDQSHKTQTPQKEDSDDENFALSENWTFQPHIRRWSRIGEMGLEIPPAAKLQAAEKTESSSKESSPDRFEDDSYDVSGAALTLALPGTFTDDSADPALNDSTDLNSSPLRRTGSERLKDGAKAILRRVESIKSRRRKRQGIVLSGQALDLSQLGQRTSIRKPDGVYSTPPSPSAVSPMHGFNKGPIFGNELKVPSQSDNFLSPNRSSPKRTPTTPRSMRASPLHFFTNTMPYLKEGKSDDSSSYYSDSQESSSTTNKLALRKTPSKTRRFLQRTGKVDDIGAHSDSECHQGRKLLIKDANSNTTEVKIKKLSRGGSLNLGRDGKKRDGLRSASFRSRSTTRKEPKPEEPSECVKRTPVVRWHSFQLEERPHMIFRKCFSQKNDPHSNEHGILFAAMSAGQLQMIRKLALVTLTGYMERYCPTHRSGWNWELPKFIKKIKMPDYKDKKVFGVPLILILQRTGQTLPIAVRAAFRWLQLNALDQIGLFRKSGVKSRILKLKELIEYSESAAECMDVFDTQQAYDVADMLKQYFRDLPESLLTTKMSETFAAIFQHLPPEVRLDSVQSAVLLLPDENREILYALLEFLTLVAANSQYNQMTANNLAVCLAPSLFHNSISTGSNSVTASPRRKGKGSGVPDAKELFEAKASHECLAFMIEHYKQIYTAPKEKLGKCKFGYMEESKPLPLEALGEGMQFHNWRGYLYESTSATIKEGREKSRGWISITSLADPSVEIAYKKVGDGHPLRLWRCITEIEGPPKDVLDYIIRQRASWDPNLLQSQTIKKFDDCTEIFQYAIDCQQCTDFCVLRSWRTDLPRGACVIVETSIDHAKAKPMFNAVRGVVLASRYLIEPCGSGRSRVMHLARVDVKGKTPEWYNKSYGHISSHFLTRIRLAFKNVAEGPESKV
ncbi:serine-rich adhesin for platelets isoform X1 [Calliphora vicina]|uniref:serine-rich adhesin for platelets isoform X1 n=1 Tax=Calliphora vicina TaxID=7373 RepID=UPI00325A7CDF